MPKTITNQLLLTFVAGLMLAAMGCGSDKTANPVAGLRPQIQLSAAPQEGDSVFYAVRLQWFSWDSDGRVTHYIYAVDPPAAGDTTWTRIERNEITLFFESRTPQNPLPSGGTVPSSDYHVFVIKAVDNEDMSSPPVFRAFTSYTVAPFSQINSPSPSRLKEAITAPTVLVEWSGQDPDGVLTQKPVLFKFKLVSRATIQQALGLGGAPPSSGDLQEYFSQDAENNFAAWDSVPPDSAFKQLEGLTPGQTWFFAVVAFDEAGAYEPRFLLDNNLLQFLPSTSLQAPRITLFNAFFSRQQLTGGIDLDERRVFRVEVPADVPVPFNWDAAPGAPGTLVTGFRWVLDPIDGDIFDETPRENENDFNRWSSWSISEKSTTIGPFNAEAGEDVYHRFYVEARDNVGSVSLVVIEIRVIPYDRDTARPLLIFDDFRAEPDRLVGGKVQPSGAFPGESVLDSIMYAVGGFPYKDEPLGRTESVPGVFAGFVYDTLDYRFFPFEGLPLSRLAQYKAVVWMIAAEDAGRRGGKFTGNDPMAALRFVNTIGELNTLAVFLSQGGDVWLFGDGVVPAIANGYVSRFGSVPFARYPLDSAGDAPSQTSILWPGNFLYDFMHARSQIELNTRDFFPTPKEYFDLIPYLPKFRTPGAPWPPVPGATPARGPSDDPRVGPSSERNLDPALSAGGWGIPAISQDLPQLTITTEWPDYPRRLPTSLDDISYISLPNFILEDHDGNPGTAKVARLDTLYIGRANREIIATRPTESDGKPVFFYYWGDDQAGDVCWTSVNIWMFEREQLQTLAEIVLSKFELYKNRNPATWTGPTSAHRDLPRLVEVPQ